jgi:1-deoxy-D-xylulose-5-phosphate synthase
VFGDWLCDMAAREPRLVAITPAMREGSGMVKYSELFPERYFDVGIAEQHAVTFAGGLACEGMKPVVAIYSTFLQRGYDQLIHDIAIQNLPVLFALDRGGLVGGDGATHNGAFDFAYLRTVPNLTVMAPADAAECRNMLFTGYDPERAVRRALSARRGAGRNRQGNDLRSRRQRRGQKDRKAHRILAFGAMLKPALEAGDALDATVVNMRFVKPLDLELVRRMAEQHELIVTWKSTRSWAEPAPRSARPWRAAEARSAPGASRTASSTTATRAGCLHRSAWTPPASRNRFRT